MSTPASTFNNSSDSPAAGAGSQTSTDAASLAKRVGRFAFQDRWFERITGSFAALVLLSMFGIIGSLIYESSPVFAKFGAGFLASSTHC